MNAGGGGVAVVESEIAARVDAFHAAAAHKTDESRLFFLQSMMQEEDIQTGSASRSRSVPPALGRSTLSATAQLAVFGNVWDQREIDLNDPVHMRLLGQAAAAGGLGQLTGAAEQALDQLQSAGNQAKSTLDEIGKRGSDLDKDTPEVAAARKQEEALRKENREKADAKQKEADAKRQEINDLTAKIDNQPKVHEQAKKDLKDDPAALEKKEQEINDQTKAWEDERKQKQDEVKKLDGEISILRKAS